METTALVIAAALSAVVVGRAARRRLGFVTVVESESMMPTLTPGEWLLTRRPEASRPVRRGDIVVVRSAELGRVIVKRVIGLPQEHVSVAAGHVRVDGRPLPEPYVTLWGGPSASIDVPDGHLLLLGDNRARSNDGRRWRQSCVPMTALQGRTGPHSTTRSAAGMSIRRARRTPNSGARATTRTPSASVVSTVAVESAGSTRMSGVT